MQKTQDINEQPLDLNTTFNSAWTLWESFKQINPIEEYQTLMNKVYTFSTVKEFGQLFGCLPHGSPSRLFYNKETSQTKKFRIPEKDFRTIDTLLLFRKDIHPSWEDENNRKGGIYYYTFNDFDLNLLDELWVHLISGLVGETLTYSEGINGVRLCDKSRPPNKSQSIRLEIWMREDQNEKTITQHNEMKKELTGLVAEITKLTKGIEPTYKSNDGK